jgi:hypothetical protein
MVGEVAGVAFVVLVIDSIVQRTKNAAYILLEK